jgi:putative sigma-54 modulation protein
MVITIEGANHDRTLRQLITAKLDALAARHRVRPVSARVGFVDENGPKGGVDTRCALSLELPRRPTLHVNELAESSRTAFDAAFEALERRMSRDVEHGRERRRRPKKYYVAKRLLAPDSETPPDR